MDVLLTDDALGEIKRRADAATPGDWSWNSYDAIGHRAFIDGEWDMEFIAHIAHLNDTDHGDQIFGERKAEAQANAEFIAHARDDIPALLKHIAALRRQLNPTLITTQRVSPDGQPLIT